ncbi:unnamed protein product [Effrenium voratum]|nr:unnamed protein product [Effrenium voratum]
MWHVPAAVAAGQSGITEVPEKDALALLQRRADVHVLAGELRRSALHSASERCYVKLVAELLKRRANPNQADLQERRRCTPWPMEAPGVTRRPSSARPPSNAWLKARQTLTSPTHGAAPRCTWRCRARTSLHSKRFWRTVHHHRHDLWVADLPFSF